MTTEVQKTIEDLGRTFEAFKKTHGEATTALEQKFASNLNDRVSELQDKLEKTQILINSQSASGEVAEKAEHEAALKTLTAFAKSGEKGYFADTLQQRSGYDITTDANGKYGVPKVIDAFVSQQVREFSSLRQHIGIKTVSTTAYNGLINNNNATAGNVAETGTRTGTSANTFTNVAINVFEIYANPAATLQMLEDVQFDAEGELLGAVAQAVAALEGSNWVNGSGDGSFQAKGFTTYTKQDITDGSLGAVDKLNTVDGAGHVAIVSQDIVNLASALPDAFAKNGKFGMSRKTLNSILKLVDGQGNYLWQPSYVAGQPSTLGGHPVILIPELSSAVTAGATPIVFADFANWYYGVDRTGMSILRDPYTVEGSVVFKFRKRQGGGLFNGRAGVALKILA